MSICFFGHKCLTEADLERITEAAAEKAVTKMTAHIYQEIGKSLIQKLFLVMGAIGLSLASWMHLRP